MEWEAQDDGVLAKILVGDGAQDIDVGTPVAIMVDDLDSVCACGAYNCTPGALQDQELRSPPCANFGRCGSYGQGWWLCARLSCARTPCDKQGTMHASHWAANATALAESGQVTQMTRTRTNQVQSVAHPWTGTPVPKPT